MTHFKRRFFSLISLILLVSLLSSCSLIASLFHSHTYRYEYDEEKHWKICVDCNEKADEEPHTLTIKESVEATCEHPGYTIYECATCGYLKEDITQALSHQYASSTGSGTRICSICHRKESDFKELTDSERYGYRYLSSLADGEKYLRAYTKLSAGIGAGKDKVTIEEALTNEEIELIYHCCSADHPECFWLSSAYQYTHSGEIIKSVQLSYLLTEDQLEDAKSAFQSIADTALEGLSASASDFEKELYLHDYIVKRAAYDETYNAPYTHSAYANLVLKTSVCDGYSKAFQFLLNRVGILATSLIGYAKGENHSWNVVRLDGEWYMVDPTWDDPTGQAANEVSHTYFNCTSEEFARDHFYQSPDGTKIENYYTIPECNSDTYDYFAYFGYEGSLSSVTIEKIVRMQSKAEQKDYFQMRFSGHGNTAEERKQAIKDLIDDDPLFYPAVAKALGRSVYSIEILYSISDDGNLLKLSVQKK